MDINKAIVFLEKKKRVYCEKLNKDIEMLQSLHNPHTFGVNNICVVCFSKRNMIDRD